MSKVKVNIPQREPVRAGINDVTVVGGGTRNYNDLRNKPSINGVTLVGDLTDEDLHIKGGNFWFGTRAEYNALPSIDPDVCYCIEEGT